MWSDHMPLTLNFWGYAFPEGKALPEVTKSQKKSQEAPSPSNTHTLLSPVYCSVSRFTLHFKPGPVVFKLLLALYSGIIPGRAWQNHGMPRKKPNPGWPHARQVTDSPAQFHKILMLDSLDDCVLFSGCRWRCSMRGRGAQSLVPGFRHPKNFLWSSCRTKAK